MSWFKRIYAALPVIRELQQIRSALWLSNAHAAHQTLILRDTFVRQLLATSPRYADRRKLNHFEFQVFSQNGEDGIIAEIFRRIGTRSRLFIEAAAGDGLENNTAYLLAQGWRGGWIEADAPLSGRIRRQFADVLRSGQLRFVSDFVTAENIESLFAQLDAPEEFDLMSLDIDRNTSHVWRALRRFRPRVVAIEYNATFPPETAWEVPYEPLRAWNRTSHFGASLKALEQLGSELGYALVGCDLSGTNAFFIRHGEDLARFAEPFTAEHHYEPPRYWAALRGAQPRGFSD